MKVIASGADKASWSDERKCSGGGNGGGGCEAKLLVESADVFITLSKARGETVTHVTFECPVCRVWSDIPNPPGIAFTAAQANGVRTPVAK